MDPNVEQNFNRARAAVSGKVGMQSSFVALPSGGASASAPNAPLSFPDASTASAAPSTTAALGPPGPPAPLQDLSMQSNVPYPYPYAPPPGQAPLGSAQLTTNAPNAPPPPLYQNLPVYNPNPDTTAFSSLSTPVPPPPPLQPDAPKPLQPRASFLDRFKKWSLSKKLSVALIVALVVVALIVFLRALFKQGSKAPQPGSPPAPKDVVVHLAQGSTLQLQGLNDGAQPGDFAAIKQNLASIQTTLSSIDAEQKALEKALASEGGGSGWKDAWRDEDGGGAPGALRVGAPASPPPASPPASTPPAPEAQRLSKTVRYSADLAMQNSPDRGGAGAAPKDRWSKNGATRFYGGAQHPCASPIHSSSFSPASSHLEQV